MSYTLSLPSFVVGGVVLALLAIVTYERLPTVAKEVKNKVSDAKVYFKIYSVE